MWMKEKKNPNTTHGNFILTVLHYLRVGYVCVWKLLSFDVTVTRYSFVFIAVSINTAILELVNDLIIKLSNHGFA